MISIRNTCLFLILVFFIHGSIYADSFQQTGSGVLYKELKPGQGTAANVGDVATIHLVSWLDDDGRKGREFLNTHKLKQTVSFVVGTDKVMPGWNQGVIGMKPGGKRLLKIPPELGYGSKGVQGRVPPNAKLIVMMELVSLR